MLQLWQLCDAQVAQHKAALPGIGWTQADLAQPAT